MNLLHLKYAVETAKAGSINKAAENLYIGQPNLSRAIKELEKSLGITIFVRSAKGMTVTPEGEEFLRYAQKILSEIDSLEAMYKNGMKVKQKFSISVPRACYISEAFAKFSKMIQPDNPAELFYNETDALHVIKNILENDHSLGIIRYEDLKPYVEITHADPFLPSMSASATKKAEITDDIEKRIFIFERASQFDLLSENTDTFMWVSLAPQKLLERYGLVKKKCSDNRRVYKDVLIYRKDYHLTDLDRLFITESCSSKRQYL